MRWLIVPVLFCIYPLCFPNNRRFTNTLTEDELTTIYKPEYRCLFYATYLMLKKEIIFVSVYVLAVVMYQWFILMNNDHNITSIHIYQWFIEATFDPLVLAATYSRSPVTHLYSIEDQDIGCYGFTIVTKIPTCIMMRYAEINTSSFLNDLNHVSCDHLSWQWQEWYSYGSIKWWWSRLT